MVFSWADTLAGLAGGAMIGAAAALMLLLNGRIAGVSGILAGLAGGPRAGENAAFVAGLVAAPLGYATLAGAPEIGVAPVPWLLALAGLLVGVGTRIGGGCTSGHGICGMSRLSPRSLAATALFMALAMAVTGLIRPVLIGG